MIQEPMIKASASSQHVCSKAQSIQRAPISTGRSYQLQCTDDQQGENGQKRRIDRASQVNLAAWEELFPGRHVLILCTNLRSPCKACEGETFIRSIGLFSVNMAAFRDWEPASVLKVVHLCRACLAETDVEQLEPQWEKLDVLWMSVRHNIQVVHDIEYGYGDPLRTKASSANDPDCSNI